MKLFANGCSHTWGGGILEEQGFDEMLWPSFLNKEEQDKKNYRLSSVWPSHLSNLLSCTETVNFAIGCGSNQRIVRTTFDFFIDKIKNNENLSDWVAVIQWTEPSRYEIYDEKFDRFNLIKLDVVIPNVKQNRYEYLQNRFYESDELFISEFLVHLNSLASFFDKWNINYRFTRINPSPPIPDYYKNNLKWVDEFSSMLDHHKIFQYKCGHPNIEGHKLIAKELYNSFKKDYN
jgi:hypothetical protein